MSLLGQRLRQAREARGISPLQVEIDTRIRASIVNALEQGDYENLPPEPFVRGLIRSYANYLNVDSEEMLGLYLADFAPPSTAPAPRPPIIKRPPTSQPESAPPPTPKPTPAPPPVKPGGTITRPIPPSVPPSMSEEPSAPPPSIPEELPAPVTPPPAVAPTRKPTAIRLPSLRPPVPRPPAPKPSLPIPAMPPESWLAPEILGADLPNAPESMSERTSLAHATRKPASLPVIAAIGAGVLIVCVLFSAFAAWQIVPAVSQLTDQTNTPTRLAPTRTATPVPGASPTQIPTLAATAPPFPTFPGNPTPTGRPATARTPETFTNLNLDVLEVTQPINLRVGVDGILVFSGQLQPGATRAWSAKDSLYVRIENPKGAVIEFNGNSKVFGARNFQETKILERQWNMNPRGTPVLGTPVPPVSAPVAVTPTSAALIVPIPSPTPATTPSVAPSNPVLPTPTLTPFN